MGKINNLSKPEPIKESHELDSFESGEKLLDDWLKQRALRNSHIDASRTFVVHQNNKVIAYYSLATGSIEREKAPGKIRRNMPNPIPVMILGRLAVDKTCQEMGIGRGLLKDATLRTMKISKQVGVKALLVHAISEPAKHFYKRYGFIQSPLEERTLMLPIKDIERFFYLEEIC